MLLDCSERQSETVSDWILDRHSSQKQWEFLDEVMCRRLGHGHGYEQKGRGKQSSHVSA